MTFDRARREALRVANGDAPLNLDTWSDAMKATAETLTRIGAEDSTVSSAARLAQTCSPSRWRQPGPTGKPWRASLPETARPQRKRPARVWDC